MPAEPTRDYGQDLDIGKPIPEQARIRTALEILIDDEVDGSE